MYNKHATSKGQTERRPRNSYEFQWTGPHGIIHIDSRHARTYTTGTHKHAESMGRTRQIGWARLGGFNVNRQVSFNNPYIFFGGKANLQQANSSSLGIFEHGIVAGLPLMCASRPALHLGPPGRWRPSRRGRPPRPPRILGSAAS